MALNESASVDGVECDVLDALGRLVVTPHALSVEGQTNVPADLCPGESLEAFLVRHVPGIGSGAWSVSLGGRVVPQSMWARTYPKHGHLIACRCVVRRSVLSLVAVAVLSYFTLGAGVGVGGGWIANTFGAGLAASQAIGAGLFMAGSMLINKVLAPKVPKPADNGPGRAVYSLSGQRNSIRAYEPLPVLWGEMRVTPDLASLPYTWNEGDDQYLSTILLGGINVHSVSDLSIGDTAITAYEDVTLYHNGFSGMPSVAVPLYSNADTIAGGELTNNGPWITRTSSLGAIALQIDIEGQLYDVDGKGRILVNRVPLYIETRAAGSAGAWTPALSDTLVHSETAVLRRTFTLPVAAGQYEVRVRIGAPRWDEGEGKDACKLSWTLLKSIQQDATDYSQWGRTGIKIKATGQLSGSLDTLRATYTAKPMPIWNGTAWVTATTRSNGLSNPGAIILQALRGVYAGSVLQFGFGLQDEQIDIEGLKAFMLHCTARGYTYDKWITSSMSLGAFCDEVALAGMGQFTWTDGSRPTVSFVSSGQPISGVVNMANMLKGSFSVAYNLSNAADGIEYQYLDRDRSWETQTLRVMAPGVTTMLSPARITGDGVTTEAHAAVLARYHLAQSLYQYKTIDFGADIEHLDYRRLSLLSVSHDLTQWGFGGRVVSAATVAGKVVLTLDEDVPALPTRYIGLRVPGARDYRVFGVEAFADTQNTVTLVGAWPAGVAFPGAELDNPAHDTLWCYDFKSTPGYRVRVVGIEPEADLKGARVSCVPEGPEFWDYVNNGTYVPAPNQSSLPQLARPSVSNLRITEEVHVQGDTEWFELHAVWDVEGEYDHAQVWAGFDGSELRLVDGNAISTRSSFRIEAAGEWLIEVRPFNASGMVGQSAAVLYITSRTDIPPRNVDQFVVQVVEGGLRRFAWQYTGDRPPAFAGVQIRYLPGDVPLSEAGWDAMTPLGKPDDIYSAQFESTRPAAGQWTFGIRAINTSGLLSPGVLRFAINLPASLPAAQAPDLTPPPKPTGVTATALMSTAQVNWTAPSYTVGRGHDHSIISAAVVVTGQPVPVFSAAVKVGAPEGQPASIPVELGGVKYRLWVQHVSKEGVASLPSDPVEITTSVDPVKILEILAGQIGTGQINASLSTPIGLITAPAGTVGSVNARIEAQRSALQANIDAVQSQLADVTGAAEYVAGTTYTAGKLAKYQDKLYRAKSTTTGNLPTNTTYWELVGEYASIGEAVAAHAVQLSDQLTRIQNVEGNLVTEAGNRNTLAVQMRGNYTGTDPDALVAGLAWNERKARVTADAANASLIQGVRTDLTAEQGRINGQATAITGLTTDISNINGRISTEAGRIDTVTSSLTTTNGNVTAAQNAANAAATAAGSKGEVIYGAAQPTVAQRLAQNLWIDTNGSANTPKRWNGSAWVAVTDKVATDAAAAAAAANSALAGKADASALSALTTRVEAEEGKTTSQGGSITSLSNSLTTLNLLATIIDTRSVNSPPSFYWTTYDRRTVLEFKNRATVGAPGTATHGTLETTVRWSDATGGPITQVFSSDAGLNIYTRHSISSEAWSVWKNDVRDLQAVVAGKAEASAMSALTTRVEAEEGKSLSQGSSLTTLNNTITHPSTGLAATKTAAENAATLAGAKGKPLFQSAQPDVADRLPTTLWIDTTANANTPKRWNGTAWVAVTDKVATDAAAAAANAVAGLANKADSSVVSALSGTVTNQGNTLTSQGNSLLSLTNSVNHATTGLAATATTANNAFTLAQTADGNATSQAGTINSVVAMVSGLGRQDEDSLLAGVLGQWQSRAAIVETRKVTADALGHVSAKYSLAVDLQSNGQAVVGGMQITGSSSADAGPVVDVAFVTNTFSVVSPDAALKTAPFYVQTSPTTINGVPVPAGVYMDSAVIGNVTALFGRFGTLVADSIQATAISASQLTLGDGTVGGVLKSSNYAPGASSWVLNPNGTAEFLGVTVQGTVVATAGTIGGITINANGLNAGAYTGYGWPSGSGTGFHLGPQGLLLGNPSTGKYVELSANGRFAIPGLVADGGNTTFSGALSGATGTFSGAMTASAIDAVDSINIRGNAVTVPRGVTAYNSGEMAGEFLELRAPGALFVMVSANWLAENNSVADGSIRAVCGGQRGPWVRVSMAPGYSAAATASGMFTVPAGAHFCSLEVTNTGQRITTSTSMFAIGTMK